MLLKPNWEKVRILRAILVDDHALVRQGLKQILQEQWPRAIFGEAGDAAALWRLVRGGDWDVVILDLSLPGENGIEVLKQLRTAHPRLPVLVLSMHSEAQYGLRALKAGAAGYMTKESASECVVPAIKKVLSGGKYVSAALAEKLASSLGTDHDKAPHELLSDREYQVLCRIAAGKTLTQIGEEMTISVKTVATYRTRLLEKMQLKSNAELTHYGIRNGLVE